MVFFKIRVLYVDLCSHQIFDRASDFGLQWWARGSLAALVNEDSPIHIDFMVLNCILR